MKRIFALLLSLILLLGTCAFAEEAAAVHGVELSDVVITYGESTIDLSNVVLGVDVVEDGPSLLVHLDADGETAAELGLTKVDGLYVLHMDGAFTGHKDFVTDPVFQLEKTLKGAIDGLISLLQGVDAHSLAEKIVGFAERPVSAPEVESTPEPTQAPDENTIVISLADVSFEGDVLGLLKGCVTETEGEELDGSNGIPAGTYDSTSFYADEETLAELLDMMYVKGEPTILGDKLRESGISMTMSLASYRAEAIDGANIEMSIDTGEETYGVRAIAVQTTDESGTTATYDITCDNKGTPVGLKFTTYSGESDCEGFSPASVDLASAINLDEMSDEESVAALTEAFKTLATDAMLPVLGSFMGAGALQTSAEAAAE